MKITEDVEKRFWSKVGLPDENGCMNWLAYKNPHGYGQIKAGPRPVAAHRVSFALRVGTVPEGKEIDHLCRNRACVAPDHLEAVTHRANMLRGETIAAKNSKKTHCKSGHEFSDENTYITPAGVRQCRPCKNRRHSEMRGRRTGRT